MNPVVISLGSNLGDRLSILQSAIHSLTDGGLLIEKISSIHETKAWGKTDQPDFLNQVVFAQSPIDAKALLHLLLQIEEAHGRVRDGEKWGPRTLDLDLLFFDNQVIKSEFLELPHPFIQERLFILEPLNEIAPDFIHPVLGKSISRLLEDLLVKSREKE